MVAIQILFIVGISSCLYFVGERSHLELKDGDSGNRLLELILEDGEEILLFWRNSLFNLEVKEKFIIDNGTLILREVNFFNLPESPGPPVDLKELEEVYQTGGPFSVQGVQKRFNQIDFRVGEIGHPKLKIKGRVLDLRELVGFGGKVRLTIKKLIIIPSLIRGE